MVILKNDPYKQSTPTTDSQTICKISVNSSFSGTSCCSPLYIPGTSKVSQSTAGWICLLFHNHCRYPTEDMEGIISLPRELQTYGQCVLLLVCLLPTKFRWNHEGTSTLHTSKRN